MVQAVCTHHEWVEATQTTTGRNDFTFTQCRNCGKVQTLIPKSQLPITTKGQLEDSYDDNDGGIYDGTPYEWNDATPYNEL